jgi:DNA-binding NtrC family response regulator
MKASKRVLVVDDDDDQFQTLCRGLLYLGHSCIMARTAAEALAQLTGPFGEDIDVLLADLTAPGKPGARLVERVRSVRPGLPVVVVTGLVRSPEAIALGGRRIPILCKPFSPDQLGRAIEAALTNSNDPEGELT